MKSWSAPHIPAIPGEPVKLSLYDTADQQVRPVASGGGLYVCGITPYDSTHLGHAATYVTFDLVNRMMRDNGEEVHYVQNITDVDDPLFERAERDGVDWRELGTDQINLFRSDMEALRVIPPRDYIGAMEAVDEVVEYVSALLDTGAAYIVDDPDYPDIYASIGATEQFGYESGYDRATMEKFFAERGGDPTREGKHDPLDAILWRAARPGEPSWDAPFGPGRPGWHVECAAIAANRLRAPFAVQGGGSDLIFPHHEFSASHVEAVTGVQRMAGHYVHTGMIGLDGVKMSKSLGNLVFVSKLTAAGHDPAAIRLGIYASHYRSDRDWSDAVLTAAERRLDTWREALARGGTLAAAQTLVAELRSHLAHDLDTPGALATIDAWASEVLAEASQQTKESADAGALVALALDGLLGIA